MKVFVTGSAGYIGTNLVNELKNRGHEVVGYDIKDNPVRDIGDAFMIAHKCKDCEVIIHLAALVRVQTSIDNPIIFNETNVSGMLNVLTVAKSFKVPMIFMSNVGAKDPLSPYTLQKRIGEQYCKMYHKLYGTHTVIVRGSNIYGGDNYLTTKDSVIANFVKARNAGKPLVIYGDGAQTRDFVHVDDVVNGLILAMMARSGVYELCTGVGTPVLEVAKMISDNIKFEPGLKGDIKYSRGDYSPSEKEFGYKPQVRLEDGIKRLLEL